MTAVLGCDTKANGEDAMSGYEAETVKGKYRA
jgi:hypothetical protein